MPKVSVVAPLHNEEGNIEPLYKGIKSVMEQFGRDYEIIFVNDCSTDQTLSKLKEIKSTDAHFFYADLETNVGENWALLAGVSKAQGNMIVTIDGDFQNDPVFIPALIKKLEEGYRVVSGWRRKRVGSYIKRIFPTEQKSGLVAQW